ncbi:MAG: hypothetical protein KBT28_04650 [Bacteroidales bacterium]|nr:hypothetical protein [Candidatus Colimorpha merdihippi]
MEQIVIYQKRPSVNGTFETNAVNLFSKKPLRSITSCIKKTTLMQEDTIQMTIVSFDYIQFQVGDYCVIDGCRYSIRSMADVVRHGEERFEYQVVFYGPMYDLIKRQYRNSDMYGRSSTATFDLTFKLDGFIRTIVNNMNRGLDAPEWECGNDDEDENMPNWPNSEYKTISFSRQNCLTALQSICSEGNFDTEFTVTQREDNGRTINVITVGAGNSDAVNDVPFSYGKGNGLFQLKESKVDDGTLITRLFVEGGTDNVKSSYRGYAGRLQLPLLRKNKYQHSFSDGTSVAPNSEMIGIRSDDQRYMEDGSLVERYGVIEDTWQSDDIHPSFTGEIISLGTDRRTQFNAYIGFDLKATWHVPDASDEYYSDLKEWCYINGQFFLDMDDYVRWCHLYNRTDEYHQYMDQQGLSEGNFAFSRWIVLITTGGIRPAPETYVEFVSLTNASTSVYNQMALAGQTKYLVDSSTPAKITFIDGKLAGTEFDLSENWQKVMVDGEIHGLFTIIPFQDETETELPSSDAVAGEPFRFAVGDHFKLTNIFLPYEYYQRAEEDLWYEAKERFEDVKQVSYRYDLTIDPLFSKANISLLKAIKAGSYIKISDSRFFASTTNYEAKLRVSRVEHNLLTGEYRFTLESIHKLKKNKLGNNWAMRDVHLEVLADVVPAMNNPQYRKRNAQSSATNTTRVRQLVANMNQLVDTFNGNKVQVCDDTTCRESETITLARIN